jgi:hypothetical protein
MGVKKATKRFWKARKAFLAGKVNVDVVEAAAQAVADAHQKSATDWVESAASWYDWTAYDAGLAAAEESARRG